MLTLPKSERDQIVSDVRAQIAAQAYGGEEAALHLIRKIGSARTLAARFTMRHELELGVQRSNPLGLIWVVGRLARTSILAFFGGIALFFLFLTGGILELLAVTSVVLPREVGVFRSSDWMALNYRIGSDARTSGYHAVSGGHALVLAAIGAISLWGGIVLLRALGRMLLARFERRARAF